MLTKFLVAILFACSSLAFAANCSTGTTFDENWNTGSDPCGVASGSTCGQTWSGTGATLTATPIGTGWDNTNVLELAHGASSPQPSAYGTIPYIPSGSNTSICFEFGYSSTTVTGFHYIFQFDYLTLGAGSASAAYFAQYGSSGTGNIGFNNGAQSCAVSANARHTITITLNGASSQTKIDGTNCGSTFTAAAFPFMRFRMFGDTGTSAADMYFGHIAISTTGYSCTPRTQPTSFFDGAGGTSGNTVTNATLLGGLHFDNDGASQNPPVYAAGTGSELIEFSNTHAPTFASPITVCGTAYTNNTGLSLQHHVVNGTPTATATFFFDTTYAIKTVGFYITPNTSSVTTTAWTDQFSMNGSYFVHICTNTTPTGTGTCTGTGSNFVFCDETSGAVVNHCAAITNTNTYWLTGECNSGGSDEVSLYNVGANGSISTLIATTMPWTFTGTNCPKFSVGAVGSENPGVTFDIYYSGLEKCVADCVFPLLPPFSPLMVPLVADEFDFNPSIGHFTNGNLERRLRWSAQ
jgi:hypothetical protein